MEQSQLSDLLGSKLQSSSLVLSTFPVRFSSPTEDLTLLYVPPQLGAFPDVSGLHAHGAPNHIGQIGQGARVAVEDKQGEDSSQAQASTRSGDPSSNPKRDSGTSNGLPSGSVGVSESASPSLSVQIHIAAPVSGPPEVSEISEAPLIESSVYAPETWKKPQASSYQCHNVPNSFFYVDGPNCPMFPFGMPSTAPCGCILQQLSDHVTTESDYDDDHDHDYDFEGSEDSEYEDDNEDLENKVQDSVGDHVGCHEGVTHVWGHCALRMTVEQNEKEGSQTEDEDKRVISRRNQINPLAAVLSPERGEIELGVFRTQEFAQFANSDMDSSLDDDLLVTEFGKL